LKIPKVNEDMCFHNTSRWPLADQEIQGALSHSLGC